jgi:xanthine dehydrogenase YagT iron-sulfur-binding subunit
MDDLTRREFVGVTAGTLAGAVLEAAPSDAPAVTAHCSLTVNGEKHDVDCDPRVTLLDLLREALHLAGTKKGCDHGQCGACTVLVNGVRVNSCLSLAVAQDGSTVTTIEGLATQAGLHPLQAAFIERDAFQCGFCTSGQICSGVGMLKEWRGGMPSAVTFATSHDGKQAELTDAEIRERMAGNICRCGAYPNIIAAMRDASEHTGMEGR